MKKIAILTVVLAWVAFIPAAFAALNILSFSCNNMDPTVNVEAGGSMNCDAVIQNTDSQNSASMSSVKLYTTGSWSDAESYTGSGFSSTISAGASTTATFSSITASIPGAAHKFLHIDIDNTAHTEEVSDISVNSITFKSMTVTPSASTSSSGSSFTVNAYLTAGGSISSASVAISLSGGCTLGTGESATKSLGTISDNVEASASWSITQGSSTCSITVDASGTSNPVTITKSRSASVTSSGGGTNGTSGTSAGGGSGGGSGGGGGGALGGEIYNLGLLPPSGASVDVLKGDIVRFTVKAASHELNVLDLTQTSLKLQVSSDPFNITLQAGETKKLGLDEDSTLDLSITLVKINWSARKATLSLAPISEVLSLGPGVIPRGGVCVPDERRCEGSELQSCRPDGLEWSKSACEFGCDPESKECKEASQSRSVPPAGSYDILITIFITVIIFAGVLFFRKGIIMKSKGRYALSVIAILAIFTLISNLSYTGYLSGDSQDPVLGCLKSNEFIFYTASWCGDCREQISLLENYSSNIARIDCESENSICLENGIREIPSWKINSRIYHGKFSPQELTSLAGC